MTIRVLAFEGCPHGQPTVALVESVLRDHGITATVEYSAVEAESDACLSFPGSPTVEVDGEDIEPGMRVRPMAGMSCRRYPGAGGVPPRSMIEAAILRGTGRVRSRREP